jgi:hypothetical protein
MHGVPHFVPSRPRSARNDHRRIGRFTQEYHASVTTAGLFEAPPRDQERLSTPAGMLLFARPYASSNQREAGRHWMVAGNS